MIVIIFQLHRFLAFRLTYELLMCCKLKKIRTTDLYLCYTEKKSKLIFVVFNVFTGLISYHIQGVSKNCLTLSPSAQNNVTLAKWFRQIVTSQLLLTHKKFQTDSWCHSFLKHLVQLYSA